MEEGGGDVAEGDQEAGAANFLQMWVTIQSPREVRISLKKIQRMPR